MAQGRVRDGEIVEGDSRRHEYSLGRVLAISDGVFAFALTLLVVQLAVPTAAGTGQSLASQLLAQRPNYFSYALSFAVIAATWTGHHEAFKYIIRVDDRLIALNFGNLLLIAVLPFPTAVLGHNLHDPAAAVLYAVTISLNGAFAAATWWYATYRHRLVDPNLPERIIRRRVSFTLLGPAVFLASIPIALWRPLVAEVVWSVLWIALLLVVRRFVVRVARAD